VGSFHGRFYSGQFKVIARVFRRDSPPMRRRRSTCSGGEAPAC
jgi:hypothetical protein